MEIMGAMKMALEALEDVQEAYGNHSKWFKDRVDALRQAIEQAEQQEPVTWRDMAYANLGAVRDKMPPEQVTAVQDWLEKVYTAPLKREWFDCTDEQLIAEVRRRGFVIRDAQIEQSEQEPVLWLKTWSDGSVSVLKTKSHAFADRELEPLYSAPPPRKPLTDEHILHIANRLWEIKIPSDSSLWFARAIEAAHGIGEKK
jgi:hypothetical protein